MVRRHAAAVLTLLALPSLAGCGGAAAPANDSAIIAVENEYRSHGFAAGDLLRLTYGDDRSRGQWHVLHVWNGERWNLTHQLVAAAFPEGSHTVLDGDDFEVIDIDYGPGTDLYVLLPDLMESGTYRVCLHGDSIACTDNLEVADQRT